MTGNRRLPLRFIHRNVAPNIAALPANEVSGSVSRRPRSVRRTNVLPDRSPRDRQPKRSRPGRTGHTAKREPTAGLSSVPSDDSALSVAALPERRPFSADSPSPPLGIPFSSPTAPVPIRYLDVARDGTAVTEPKAITRQEERPHAENGKERRFAFLHVPPERPAKRTAESGFVRDESEPHPPEKRRSRRFGSSAFYFSGEALPPRSTLPGTVSSVPATLSGRRKTDRKSTRLNSSH